MKHLLSCLICLGICAIAGPAWGIPYGLTGILPVWDGPAPTDGIGMRFRFNVADNDSHSLKLIFGSSRLSGPDADTYLLEYNIYDRGLRYDDGVNTTWPLEGTYTYQQASLRVAVPDYILKGKTGSRTFFPEMFPRQTYEIDGIDGLWKTDLMSQTDMNRIDGSVVLTRGDIVTSLAGWRTDGSDLPDDIYRQWNFAVSFGGDTYDMAFALPDANARWLSPVQIMAFYSEFLHTPGLFRVNYWDFGIKREGSGEWEPVNIWRVSHHDGSLDDFGVAFSSYADTPVIEFGNDPASTYLPVDTIIDITPMSVPEPETFYLFIIGALALLGRAVRCKPKRLNV